ncbi:RNase A-like domain-containing protein [Streptomyces sp. NPDC059255]|uniref:RNase A-like domain-containing protein n=1 Tax=Streptomyces sp. NPDC059255 TaxID=3346793 RepID=UPI0036B519D8
MTTPPPAQSGGFDVKPSDLNRVSGIVAAQQSMLNKSAGDFVFELIKYPDCGGYGTAAKNLSAAYVKVGNRFLDVWARSIVSVGGVAVGFTTTANNYTTAEAASHPSGSKQPTLYPIPQVIDKEPVYQRMSDLRWGDMDDYSSNLISWILEGIPDWAMDILRDLIHHVYRWGKAGDILPLPDYLEIDKVALAWLRPGFAVSQVDSTLTGAVSGITDPNNGEWQAAMRQFTSSLWGTTAWGKSTAGYEWKHDTPTGQGGSSSHPVMTVLFDTTQQVSKIMREFAEAAEEMRRNVHQVFRDAAFESLPNIKDGLDLDDFKKLGKSLLKMGKNLGLNITLNIDTGAINAAVTKYEGRLGELESRLKALLPALDEAYESAPTYQAEVARSQGFGARALNEFKQQPKYTVPGEDKENHFYPVDLANQEGVHGSHVLDKHVGQSDSQLLNRLRDQPTIAAASTFPDLAIAQKATQDSMDEIGPDPSKPENAGKPNLGVNNPQKIENWLSRPRGDNSILTLDPVEFDYATGRTIPAGSSSASDTHSVKVVLKYKNGIDPPYVVYTSMPAHP